MSRYHLPIPQFEHDNAIVEATLAYDRARLWEKMKVEDEAVMAELRSFSAETALICHCPQPGPCHGHVVKAAWHWLQTQS